MDKFIVPGRFTDIDILFMWESLNELNAYINAYTEGDGELYDLSALAGMTDKKMEEISNRVSISSLFHIKE